MARGVEWLSLVGGLIDRCGVEFHLNVEPPMNRHVILSPQDVTQENDAPILRNLVPGEVSRAEVPRP